jgi:hypothetical protein
METSSEVAGDQKVEVESSYFLNRFKCLLTIIIPNI